MESFRGHKVMTVAPCYKACTDIKDTGIRVPVKVPTVAQSCLQQQRSLDQCCNTTLCQAATHSHAVQAHARLFHQKAAGVDRVFVQHPLLHSPCMVIGEASSQSNTSSTYLEGADAPNLDLQYSILCQAALAAPILIWHQPEHHLATLRQQARLQSLPLTLSGGLVQHVGVDKTAGSALVPINPDDAVQSSQLSAQPHVLSGDTVHATATSSTAAGQHQKGQADQQTTPWLDINSHAEESEVMWPETAGQIAFIGNDWPCAPLSQHLTHLQSLADKKAHQQKMPQAAAVIYQSDHNTGSSNFDTQLARLLKSARVALCIHNMAYQGIFPQATYSRLCLPDSMQHHFMAKNSVDSACQYSQPSPVHQSVDTAVSRFSSGRQQVQPSRHSSISKHGCHQHGGDKQIQETSLNWMQAAVQSSHCLLTVSQAFAAELVRDPCASHGLHELLQSRTIRGITNGIDTSEWDPAKDMHLPASARYNSSSISQGKAAAKAYFQQQHGLHQTPDIPLIAFVGRLSAQKGADVLLAALPHLLSCPSCKPASAGGPPQANAQAQHETTTQRRPVKLNAEECQIAALGAGEFWMERCLQQMSEVFPKAAVGLPEFSEECAHQLLAAADYVLVPSRFEPCGLVALQGQRYGAVPIVASVGGLTEVVTCKNGYAMGRLGPAGSSMHLRADAKILAAAVHVAVDQFGSRQYKSKQQAGMTADLSWKAPAAEWEQVLREMLSRPAHQVQHV